MTFAFKPRPGGRIRVDTLTAADEPHVWLSVTNTRGEHAAVFLPLANVEEVVAGLRDMARQAGGQAPGSTCMCGHRKDQHVAVSGRLLCDSCDPDDTTRPTCTSFVTLAAEADGQQS